MAASPAIAHIQSIGARCPLGLTPLSLAMGVRARKTEPQSIGLRDKRDNPIGLCLTPGLPETLMGYDRLLALAAPALKEAIRAEGGMASIPIALALAEPAGPHHAEWMARDMVADLAALTGIALDRKRSVTLHQGRAGGALALEAAISMLVQQGEKQVLWGGVDSYLHEGRLRYLDEECRLHALGVDNGFIPSEGAAFLLLTLADSKPKESQKESQTPLASILGVDNEREESIPKNEPNIAKALTGVLRKAHDHIGGKIPWLLSDLNGERHSLREWQFAASRGYLADNYKHDRFADDLGDMGAAAGPTLATIACMYFRAGCAPSRTATFALQSDGMPRGTFVLEETSP